MAELTNAMKGVIQSSTARTSSTYASTDLIQLYDSNNEPTIKIGKDDLMAAVKASLPSLLSDQGTSGTTFPSIASGVLGSMTAANLASVLGVSSSTVILSPNQTYEIPNSSVGGIIMVASDSDGYTAVYAVMYSARGIDAVKELTTYGSSLRFTLERSTISENRNIILTNVASEGDRFYIKYISL